jgi:hypothetical protein
MSLSFIHCASGDLPKRLYDHPHWVLQKKKDRHEWESNGRTVQWDATDQVSNLVLAPFPGFFGGIL